MQRRGVLFAPVYFEPATYARRDYQYSPRIVIQAAAFTEHLFVRPSHHHYYFGDYYAPQYSQSGFHFQDNRHGYDPIYSHRRWEHRNDREWEHRVQASYQDRRDHESARPPRTWAAQMAVSPVAANLQPNRVALATPMDQLAKGISSLLRFQPVAREESQRLAQRSQEVQRSREQRRTLEAIPVATIVRQPGVAPAPVIVAPVIVAPVIVQLPRSPIVARPTHQLDKQHAPPQAPRTPEPDVKVHPKAATIVPPAIVDRSNPQPAPPAPRGW